MNGVLSLFKFRKTALSRTGAKRARATNIRAMSGCVRVSTTISPTLLNLRPITGWETCRVKQCEVTYINHIVAGEGWETHADTDKVFTICRQPQSTYPGKAQDLTFRARFPIFDHSGSFVGRLHVTLQPVMRLSDGKPMFVLDLTARGQIGDGTDFFNLGREWIVRSFTALTTPSMHKIWGRRK